MRRLAPLRLLVALLALAPCARADSPSPETPPGGPLEAYLRRPQPSFRWQVRSEEQLGGTTLLRVELVSQVWRGLTWTHRLNVLVPAAAQGERARPGHCVLAIAGGGSESDYLALLSGMATRLGVPVAIVHDVPNQPLFMEASPDGRGLREDALIAHTFVQYLETGETDWPLLLPMARSVVAAMDALGELSEARARAGSGWAFGRLERFLTTGASKRGWTTWLTAVVAPERVIGIAPIVYDNLNAGAQLRHHFEVWGHPSPSIHDYTDRGLVEAMNTPRGRELMAIVDPYSYRSRLTLPKLALMGTNDTYWPVDAVNLYRGDLPGDFFCHYVPNGGHSAGLSVVDAIAGFFDHVTHRTPALPTVTLSIAPRGSARIGLDEPEARARAGAVRLWATRIEGTDFTKASWERVDARAVVGGWEAELPSRCREAGPGSLAFIGEVELRTSEGGTFTLHAPVQVWELGPTRN